MKKVINKFYLLLCLGLVLFYSETKAQSNCIQVFDGTGNVSSAPYWISCTGLNFNLNLSSPNNLNGYSVNWGDGSPVSSGAVLNANTALSHVYSSVVDTFVVTISTSSPVCTITGVVVMETPVSASFNMPSTQACLPANLQFVNTSSNVSETTVFTWNYGDGSPAQTFNFSNAGQTINHTYQAGSVNCQPIITLTAENYCSNGNPSVSTNNSVNLFQKDIPDISSSSFIKCSPQTSFTFTNSSQLNCSSQGNNSPRFERWNFGDYWGLGRDSIVGWLASGASVSVTINYPGPGNYDVTMADSSFCGIDSISTTVSVVAAPTAGVTANALTACVGTPMSFSNTSTPGFSYLWNFGDSPNFSSAGPGSQTTVYSSAGTYTVSVVAYVTGGSNNCIDTATVVVNVLPKPIASFTASSLSGCDQLNVSFTDNSVGAISWSWNLGNSTSFSGQNPPAQVYNPGTYSVSLQVTDNNGCIKDTIQTVKVFQPPLADFVSTNVCQNTSMSFSDGSVIFQNDSILSWSWDFGDGSPLGTSQNPTHVYSTSGSINVHLTIQTANCSHDTIKAVTVLPRPVANFGSAVTSGCNPLTINFVNNSTGAVNYVWQFGNGDTSIAVNPAETFFNTTGNIQTYTVTLYALNAFVCKDTFVSTISVLPQPIGTFTQSDTVGCSPLSINFSATSSGINTYLWDFGDGSPPSNSSGPTHSYSNTSLLSNDTSIVNLIVSNSFGCSDTVSSEVIVFQAVKAEFLVDTVVCSQELVSFTNLSQGGQNYSWDFGDGTSLNSVSPTNTYLNTGLNPITYTVVLIATSGNSCSSVFTEEIEVYPNPTAVFSASPQTQLFPSNTVNIVNTSPNASALNHIWTFGNGQTSNAVNPGSVSYPTWGEYEIKLVLSSQFCSDTLTDTIRIIAPVPIASFSGSGKGCLPLTVTFDNNSLYGNSYLWDFGDGFTSTDTFPTHVFSTAGVFDVKLTVIGDGGTADTLVLDSIEVLALPQLSISVSPTTVNILDEQIVTVNNSQNTVNYLWNFGDGNTTTAVNPTHTYDAVGEYQIILIGVSSDGCKDTLYYSPKIIAEEKFSFEMPNAFTPGEAVIAGNGFYDPNATNNDILHPVLRGVEKFEMSIYNRWGELIFNTTDQRIGWDGFFKDKPCAQDVYIWKVKLQAKDGSEVIKTGDVLLIK